MERFVLQSYKEIKDNLKGKKFSLEDKKPYMKYREIQLIEDILYHLKPKNCLEWGAGCSTLYFPGLLAADASWMAIENNKDWYEKICHLIKNTNISIHFIPANQYPYTDTDGDGGYDDLKDYIEFPSQKGVFDFILIDGRARKECLLKAFDILDNKGVVVVHDAHRTAYHEPFHLFGHQVLFTDFRRTAGGIWIGSKGVDINNLIDIKKHQKRWRLLKNKLAKILNI